MPVTPTYPGVYIEELAERGPPDHRRGDVDHGVRRLRTEGRPSTSPITVQSFTEYARVFGGLAATAR